MSLQYKSKIPQVSGKITFRADLDLRTMLNFGICLDISLSSLALKLNYIRKNKINEKFDLYRFCVNSP